MVVQSLGRGGGDMDGEAAGDDVDNEHGILSL